MLQRQNAFSEFAEKDGIMKRKRKGK